MRDVDSGEHDGRPPVQNCHSSESRSEPRISSGAYRNPRALARDVGDELATSSTSTPTCRSLRAIEAGSRGCAATSCDRRSCWVVWKGCPMGACSSGSSAPGVTVRAGSSFRRRSSPPRGRPPRGRRRRRGRRAYGWTSSRARCARRGPRRPRSPCQSARRGSRCTATRRLRRR